MNSPVRMLDPERASSHGATGSGVEWCQQEVGSAHDLTLAMESVECERQSSAAPKLLRLCYVDAQPLLPSLASVPSGLICLQLCRELGFDTPRALEWKFEHKLVQALILHAYVPHCVPETIGLSSYASRFLAEDGNRDVRGAISSAGLHLKTGFGYGSGEIGGDLTPFVMEYLAIPPVCRPAKLWDERFVVQRAVKIAREFRVHSVESAVVPDLTASRYSNLPGSSRQERAEANEFVQSILNALPDALVSRAIYGWDVARQTNGEMVVIEVNVAGMHRHLRPGFHFSGFFKDASLGPLFVARLLRFVERSYGTSIRVVDGVQQGDAAAPYWWTARWKELLDVADRIAELSSAVEAGVGTRPGCQPNGDESPLEAPWKDVVEAVHAAGDPTPQLSSSIGLPLGFAIDKQLSVGQNCLLGLLSHLNFVSSKVEGFWPI